MLAIKKRYQSLRALSAGSIAFALGIAGAAAYVGSNLAHQNLTFNKAQTATSQTNTAPAADNTGAVMIDGADHQGAVLYEQPQPAATEPVVTTASPTPVALPLSGTANANSSTSVLTMDQSTATTEQTTEPSTILPLCSVVLVPVLNQNCRP